MKKCYDSKLLLSVNHLDFASLVKMFKRIFQGFPNTGKEWRRESEILVVFFYRVVGTLGRVILTNRTFFKAKNSFCEY